MKTSAIALLLLALGALTAPPLQAQPTSASIAAPTAGREHLSMDKGWKFAYGHAYDTAKDFGYGTAYFFFAKTGYGDGPAAASFDDRAWRTLNLPHDWAVELPFDRSSNGGHGFKPVGRRFPENSVGWYRKTFSVPQADFGRRLTVQFDGIYRNAEVYVNGFFLGRQPSGYTASVYDMSAYLNYGGRNTIAVRADATVDEGWYYEGAGIYRHVWLNKTAPLHVAHNGTYVTTEMTGNRAAVTARATLENHGTTPASFAVRQEILDSAGRILATANTARQSLQPADSVETSSVLRVNNPQLWSLETPTMHRLVTTVMRGTTPIDHYETPFGIRTVRFDPNLGFFLNGQHVVLKGTNNHQDFAGVGVAVPDALQEYRVARLKAVGCNAYRTSHHPPTPELLDACDRLGMLVVDEHRMMGTSPEMTDQLRAMIVRDRNHPSVIIWSVGNEEWAIEGNQFGERITAQMQAVVKRLDPSRRSTFASSGGWGNGSSRTTDVMGFNYRVHGDSDKYHADFPNVPTMASEETTPRQSRGVYFADPARGRASLFDPTTGQPINLTFENAFTHWSTRPYSAGVFLWTGFDYRGEVANGSEIGWQAGILDSVGTPKDSAYYYKSWWTDAPMIHLMPHWNWRGREGQSINVWGFSNCDEVELFLNGKTLGRKAMKRFSHLEWPVNYEPGTLLARGYKAGREVVTETVSTTGAASPMTLAPHKTALKADGEDVSVVAVQIGDASGKTVPDAENVLSFTVQGPGKILAVANGEQGSFEPDQFLPTISTISVANWKSAPANSVNPQVSFDFDDSAWQVAFARRGGGGNAAPASEAVATTYRGTFEAPELAPGATATFLVRELGAGQIVYLNGSPILSGVLPRSPSEPLVVDRSRLRAGRNVIAVVATPQAPRGGGGGGNATSPALVRIDTPAPTWKRKAFGGIAYVMVQSMSQPGEIIVTATSPGLPDASVKIAAQAVVARPSVPAE